MGSSQPTPSMQMTAFRADHEAFRIQIQPRLMQEFDALVRVVYRNLHAINMCEDLDFAGRANLVGLLDISARLRAVERHLGLEAATSEAAPAFSGILDGGLFGTKQQRLGH